MLNLDIIFLRDLKNYLPYSDMRSIRSYLLKYQIEIFGGRGAKRQYILRTSLERAQLQNKINDLSEKLGKNWVSLIESEIELLNQYKRLLEITERQMPVPEVKKASKPLGERGANFLKSLSRV